MKIQTDEMIKISRQLEQHHAIFYQLFELGQPELTKDIPTACVTFDEGRNVGFQINPKFWQTLTVTQKAFVAAHECLHVILDHGMRSVDAKCPEACNIAMDVVVNELLVEEFGFDRKQVDPKNKLCWRDKIFQNKSVEKEQTFEYYYNRLEKMIIQMGKGGSKGKFGQTVDDHSQMKGQSLPSDVAEQLANKLSDAEKKKLGEALKRESTGRQAGTVAGTLTKIMKAGPRIAKRTWERVIERWTKKGKGDDINEQWIRTNRRLSTIESGIILPSEMEDQEAYDFNKVKLFLFLDTSSSCEDLANQFWKAYESIPQDKFDIQLFCFDIRVYNVDPTVRRLYGFGGTAFSPIENKIQKLKQQNGKYPDAVFIFTDGEGSSVHPEFPKRWHWFLSQSYTKQYIPKESHSYKLADFV